MCIVLFAISFASFLASIFVTPGYMVSAFDFVELIDTFLENNIHLYNLCVFCEVIKGERSFHCTICNKCSDNYDHHCPFIDNCLGTRNHKYFLIFIFSYLTYSLLVIVCTLKHVVVIVKDPDNHLGDIPWTSLLFILVVIPFPVLLFQIKEQCRSLRTRKYPPSVLGGASADAHQTTSDEEQF